MWGLYVEPHVLITLINADNIVQRRNTMQGHYTKYAE